MPVSESVSRRSFDGFRRNEARNDRSSAPMAAEHIRDFQLRSRKILHLSIPLESSLIPLVRSLLVPHFKKRARETADFAVSARRTSLNSSFPLATSHRRRRLLEASCVLARARRAHATRLREGRSRAFAPSEKSPNRIPACAAATAALLRSFLSLPRRKPSHGRLDMVRMSQMLQPWWLRVKL